MKYLKFSSLFLAFAVYMAACTSAPKSDEAEVSEAQEVNEEETAGATELAVNTEASVVSFVGTKPVGRHSGEFKISEGVVKVENNEVVGGSYTIDISSLKITDKEADLDAESRTKLAGHLSGADFFDKDKFGTAKFEITKVEPYTAPEEAEETSKEDAEFKLTDPTHFVTGNLELKGVTKSVKFPAKITVDGKKVSAEAKFNIDRKDWGMSYGADESLGDKFIRPTVHIGFKVEAGE